jgi:phosphoribosylaminoimidazole synthetase
MASNKLTYSKSGVNIPKADSFVKFISSLARKSSKSGDFKNIGGFGAISPIPRQLKDPHIVTSTDGVGTKIEIANDLNKFDTIGIDLVAMCVNDLVVQGAKPYLFLDYISISKINLNKLKYIVRGIVKGCDIAGCKLVGGETAEMPGTYTKGKFDIAGFAVGLVEKKKILNKKIRNNDLILSVPSNGLHSNGYSLVRYLLKKKKINFKTSKFLKNELIRPTKIYVKELSLINDKNLINGCANITGGGLVDNIQRIIPKNLCAEIDLNRVKTLKIFRWLYKMGVSEKEMLKTFNCGVGFCLVTNPRNLNSVSKYFGKKFKPYIIGKIVKNSKKIKLSGKISW